MSSRISCGGFTRAYAGRWLAVVAVLCCATPSAHAHGTFPGASGVAFDPMNPQRILVTTSIGLLLTEDGGEHWNWLCIAAYGAQTWEDPRVAIAGDGAIVVGRYAGYARSSDGCGFEEPANELQGATVADLVAAPDGARLYALTVQPDGTSRAYATDDAGLSWEPLTEAFDDVYLRRLVVAPSNPNVLYISGLRHEPGSGVGVTDGGEALVLRSSDGGRSWETTSYDLDRGEYDMYILGVDPRDPLRLIGRTSGERDERILHSDDGGQTFVEALRAVGPFLAFAIAEDGERVYVGSDRSGLWRSDDAGASFVSVDQDLAVHCLTTRGDELWLCPGYARAPYELGRSRDFGATFEPVLQFEQFTGETVCGAGAGYAEACAAELPQIRTMLDDLRRSRDATAASADPVTPERDAGAIDGAAADAGARAESDTDAVDGAPEDTGPQPPAHVASDGCTVSRRAPAKGALGTAAFACAWALTAAARAARRTFGNKNRRKP